MKKIALTLLTGIIWINVSAQDKSIVPEKETKKKKTIVRPDHCPGIYITTSTGVNNTTAILGFSFEAPISKNVSIEAGPGTGTWGNKLYGGVKYYLKPCQRDFAFGAGLAYCPGVHHDRHDLETAYGKTESILYNKNPQTNALFTAHKYWSIGKKYNRIYLETGWSMLLSHNDKITQLSGHRMSDDAANDLESGIQNGPILAAGISFGLH